MKISEINKIIKDELRKNRDSSVNYKNYLSSLFKLYRQSVKRLSESSFKEELPEGLSRESLEKEILKCTNALLLAYNSYMEGKLSTAIKIMNNRFLSDDIVQTYTLNYNQKWFRARIKGEGKNGFEPRSMFHIPFEMRTNVMNYRYSISGHPCFYFGNTILTCWEEMHCPSLDDLVVSRIEVQANETLKVLDLRLPKEENKGEDKKIANKRLLMTWPLIIACSIKTITPNAPFKFEYVHPQLLMLALKENNKEYWGIAYTSTHIDPNMSVELSNYTNIAMPVRCIKENGYCEKLARSFKLSRGISFMEAEIKNILEDFNNRFSISYAGELCIKSSKNGYVNYEETKFGRLESFLSKYIRPESIG